MSSPVDDPVRRIVPRWRPWRETARLGLLAPSQSVGPVVAHRSSELEKAELEWRRNKTPGHAGDFMGIAFSSGHWSRALDAAEFVIQLPGAPRAAYGLARRIVGGDEEAGKVLPPESITEDGRRKKVKSLKSYLTTWPRDALTWMDLARHYTILGQQRKAKRAVDVASALAPNSRLVVLSASRFYLRLGELDRAHVILRGCPRVQFDPWMLAAELALAQILAKTSDLIRVARRTLKAGDVSPFHLSELACALGTVEMEAGTRKTVRRLFRIGLADPTENAIAQAGWVSRSDYGLELESGVEGVERQYEAQAWGGLVGSRWSESIEGAKMWLRDEPFSSRPAKFGSWVAQVTSGDYATSAGFAKAGLVVEPRDAMLLNNLVVCLANMGHLVEARSVFARISPEVAKADSEATYLATEGLLAYRAREFEAGRLLYERAVRAAGTQRERVWALLYFAREESRVDRETAGVIHRLGCEALERLSGWEKSVAERIAARDVEADAGIVVGGTMGTEGEK